MLKKDKHRLLKRQLKKSGMTDSDIKSHEKFLDMVNDAYESFDRDHTLMETILEESSKELFRTNQNLKSESNYAKSRLNNIVNSVQDVLFQTDLYGNFVYLNKAWNELTGLSWRRSLGKNYKDLLGGLNRSEKQRLQRFMNEKQKKFHTVFKYYKPNKEAKWIDLNLLITYDQDGNPNGTIGTMADVTSLKQIQIELQKANKAKDDFLSTMSHEIRTPLNAVIGLTNILMMEKHLPDQKENFEALKYSGQHLLGLINNILDLNKIQSGNVHYVENEFSLEDLLKEIRAHFKMESEGRKLDFKITKDGNIPDKLLGDRLMLITILKNLLSNAFKFTDHGLIELSINMVSLKAEEAGLLFKVSDTGIGIPKQKQKKIFDSFVQAERNTSRLYGGTGLGLTISRKILRMQNSELNLISRPGEGSIFSFHLKFKVAKTLGETLVKKDNKTKVSPINLKVLVAEDNKLNQMVLKKLFGKWDIYYKITSNGEELLEAFEKEDYDLILMDLQMPILDGYQATKRIRGLENKTKANIPIIALTAFAQDETRERTEKYKMNGFVTKPFDPNEFHNLLSFYGNKIQNTA